MAAIQEQAKEEITGKEAAPEQAPGADSGQG